MRRRCAAAQSIILRYRRTIPKAHSRKQSALASRWPTSRWITQTIGREPLPGSISLDRMESGSSLQSDIFQKVNQCGAAWHYFCCAIAGIQEIYQKIFRSIDYMRYKRKSVPIDHPTGTDFRLFNYRVTAFRYSSLFPLITSPTYASGSL